MPPNRQSVDIISATVKYTFKTVKSRVLPISGRIGFFKSFVNTPKFSAVGKRFKFAIVCDIAIEYEIAVEYSRICVITVGTGDISHFVKFGLIAYDKSVDNLKKSIASSSSTMINPSFFSFSSCCS